MKRIPIILLGILSLGAGLRLYGLGAKGLWYDELASANFLRFSAAEVVVRSAESAAVHPPLYFLLLKVWALLLGNSEIGLRSLATACGILTILGVYSLVAELAEFPGDEPAISGGAASLAAALTALNPLQVQLSQQVRGYSLAAALLTWGGAALIRALRGERRCGVYWILASILATAACYTHHLAVISIASQGLFAAAFLWDRSRSDRTKADRRFDRITMRRQLIWASSAAATVVVGYLIPWSTRLVAQGETIRQDFLRPIGWQGAVDQMFWTLFGTFSSPRSHEWFVAWVACMALAGVAIGLVARGGWRGRYFILTGLAPVAIMIAYSCASNRSIVLTRYLSFAQLSWLSGIAVLIYTISSPPGRSILVAWACGLMIFACYDGRRSIGRTAEPGIRAAADYVVRHRVRGEPVLGLDAYGFFGLSYYLRGEVRPVYCVAEARRGLYRGSEHLRDEDLATPEGILASDPPGLWTVSGGHVAWEDFRHPETSSDWDLAGRWTFQSDHSWEGPIIVEHYKPWH